MTAGANDASSLRQIDDTQSDYLGSMAWLMYKALGSREHMDQTRWGDQHWPEGQWYFIGDEGLLEQAFAFRSELVARPMGGGFSQTDVGKWAHCRVMWSPPSRRSAN